jgi:hypothetical protein
VQQCPLGPVVHEHALPGPQAKQETNTFIKVPSQDSIASVISISLENVSFNWLFILAFSL